VPLIGVHVAYVIAVDYAYLQPCIPYLDGCTSISGTGRYPPASFLFKAVEMAMAVALPVFWYFSVKWLRALDPNWHSHAVWSIFLSGAVGALALIIYVTFLGTKEPRSLSTNSCAVSAFISTFSALPSHSFSWPCLCGASARACVIALS
jgi:hypothetical protein